MSAYANQFFPFTRFNGNANIQSWPTLGMYYGPGFNPEPPPPPDDLIQDTSGEAIQDTTGAGIKQA